QEALYPGAPTSGIDRVQDPVTVGIPLPDDAGIRSASQLGLENASVAQFRVLGRWPSGNIEWLLVDTQADLKAGMKNTQIALTLGKTGNFGGPDLATDDGPTISVNTGTALFVIRKGNFSVFEKVIVAGRLLVAPGASEGLSLMGPENHETSCHPATCTTQYLSRYDNTSTAVIEENGPARAVIKAEGTHRDSSGHGYMRFTVRMHFYKNKTFVKLATILRNADEGSSNSFDSAAKAFTSYELRIAPNLAGHESFAFGTDNGTLSGNFSGVENAYLYQAYSNSMEHAHWNGVTCPYGVRVPRCIASFITRKGATPPYSYAQNGFQIVHGGQVPAGGDHSHYPAGWADLRDKTGAGVEIGVYQIAASWPKSLEFRKGGAEVRIGIWPDQSLSPTNPTAAIPYYQAWPQYSMCDVYINFHAAPLPSPEADFLAFQHRLLARAPVEQYNRAQVFAYPLLSPLEEDNYWQRLSSIYGFRWFGNSPVVKDASPKTFRVYAWPSAGGSNQSELRWGYIEQWLTRGLAGRYLTAANFYRYQAEQAFPRSDFGGEGKVDFDWRLHSPKTDLDNYGFPANIESANSAYVNRTWVDQEHAHWYGMGDFYFLTGDESIKDAMLDGVADRFLNSSTRLNQGYLWNTRAIGAQLIGIARYRRFLQAIGRDSDMAVLDAAADATLRASVFPELCLSRYPPGCDPTKPAPRGVSRTRGIADGGNDVGSDNNCSVGHGINIRCAKPWMMAIEEQGLWEIAQARGPSWPNNQTGVSNPYQLCLDLAYGMANWTTHEDFVQGHSYGDSGLKYDLAMDYANSMAPPKPGTDVLEQFEFNYFILAQYNGDLTEEQRSQFELTYLHMAAAMSFNASGIDDHDMYLSSAVIAAVLHRSKRLIDVPVDVERHEQYYKLSWTVPPGAQAYRIKRSDRRIVDWIGFDPKRDAFTGDPASTVNWFAATEVVSGNGSTCPPAPAATGSVQSCTIPLLDPNGEGHFALKAIVSIDSRASSPLAEPHPGSPPQFSPATTISVPLGPVALLPNKRTGRTLAAATQ
ncbi:MAG TPA: hypothetical protein VND65_22930, partial [Candidatus Binatia bacterium]|nr:hypothetical protein [Candidatus Binatia bacterium]